MRSRSELGCGQYRHAVASGRLGPYAPNLDAVTLRTWMRSVPPRGSVGSSCSLRSELGCGHAPNLDAVTLRTWMRSVPQRGSVGSSWSLLSALGCVKARHLDAVSTAWR